MFALIKDKLISVSSILSQVSHHQISHIIVIMHTLPRSSYYIQSEEHQIVAGQLSPTCSHIGVTVSHPESGVHLQFHQLPVDSWHTELTQYMDKLAAAIATAAEGGQPNQLNVQVPTGNLSNFCDNHYHTHYANFVAD